MKVGVGQKASRSLRLTTEHVRTYAELTGDYNPLHFDEAFAAGTRFKRLVVQGGLTTGLLHALVAMDLPGPGTVFLSQNWKFTAPVYIGDTITAEAEVVSVHATKPVCQLRIKITRAPESGMTAAESARDGSASAAGSEMERGAPAAAETVLEGEAWCYTLRPEG